MPKSPVNEDMESIVPVTEEITYSSLPSYGEIFCPVFTGSPILIESGALLSNGLSRNS